MNIFLNGRFYAIVKTMCFPVPRYPGFGWEGDWLDRRRNASVEIPPDPEILARGGRPEAHNSLLHHKGPGPFGTQIRDGRHRMV